MEEKQTFFHVNSLGPLTCQPGKSWDIESMLESTMANFWCGSAAQLAGKCSHKW